MLVSDGHHKRPHTWLRSRACPDRASSFVERLGKRRRPGCVAVACGAGACPGACRVRKGAAHDRAPRGAAAGHRSCPERHHLRVGPCIPYAPLCDPQLGHGAMSLTAFAVALIATRPHLIELSEKRRVAREDRCFHRDSGSRSCCPARADGRFRRPADYEALRTGRFTARQRSSATVIALRLF